MWGVGNGIRTGFHRPQATGHEFYLPPPSGEVAAGRRRVVCQEVGCRVWEVGKPRCRRAKALIAVFPQATSHLSVLKTPTPALPQGEGALFCSNQAVDKWRGIGPVSLARSALGRGLVSFSFCLFTSLMPIPHAMGGAEAMATIN